jgi:Ca-activated chloride channel family protein
LPFVALVLVWTGSVQAHGILIPADKSLPPLAMLHHKVNISIDDQVAITRVEQTFRNHTDRQLEATYVFPVPRGAGVNRFTMLVNGKEVSGEMLEAAKARSIYTEIVRRTQDPGLLEYVENNLFRLRVFPILPKSDQKVTLSYTSIAPRDADLVEYVYPLKTDGKATRTLEEFSIQATIKSQHPIQNVYSPTHAVTLNRTSDREVTLTFEREQALLDKDFQLFYSLSDQDVGLTALAHRPLSGEPGYFMLLVSPRLELARQVHLPRDLVFVLDTSGSMAGEKMEQAKKALRYCLGNLHEQDRFALLNFSTTVNKYRDALLPASAEQIEHAQKWVDNLRPAGGTAINDALASALAMRSSDDSRTFTVVFFTDGMPTIGETNPDKILRNVGARNTANTRIFTFGVGDDVNATMLDQLAEQTRALSTYVRPAEDIQVKVASLYGKISHPVLANLKLSVNNDISFEEVYPPHLPDLFHGGQLVVLGRYTGKGPAAITLSGTVGKESRQFAYDVHFPERTSVDKEFVEHVWARRKVGYLLDQIRANGEKKELVDEVTALARKYGIATPYTSYLIVPDGPVPVVNQGPGRAGAAANNGKPDVRFHLEPPKPAALAAPGPNAPPVKVAEFARQVQTRPGDLPANRGNFEQQRLEKEIAANAAPPGTQPSAGQAGYNKALQDAVDKKQAYDDALARFRRKDRDGVQAGKLGVDLSVQTNNLRNQTRLEQTAQRNVAGRNCLEIGGVWIDEGFEPTMQTVTVKAMSEAYFRILERHPRIKEVFQLGNHLVWVAPSGAALVIDTTDGKEQMTDAEIDQLFIAKK